MTRIALTLILLTLLEEVQGTFVLTVKFINYTNPTGLCAECSGGLESVTSADQLTPVCCDESPFRLDNCDNTGEARCDTRFRWTLRPFGAPLKTRPVSMPGAANPPYHFTDCGLSPTTCPFSEMSTTFSQGPTGFLGVAANPLTVVPRPTTSSTFTSWPGQVQFFIEAVDSGLPNIIDSLLINLDNLQLGADFTGEMIFTGYHNISHMTMSFRVACQTGFCGRDCTVRRLTGNVVNPRIFSCHTDGTIVCTDSRYDPSASCNECFHGMDISTDCSTCLPNFDPDTNCTACLPGYDIDTDCSTCLYNYDPSTNCTTCWDSRFDPNNTCTSCLLEGHDPLTNCTQCLPNRDFSTNCTQCLPNRDLSTNCTQCSPGWDISSDCMSCLPGRDLSTNCQGCLPNRDPSTNCSTCLSSWDISSGCTRCLQPGKDPNTNCIQCLPNRDLSTNCTQCLPNRDLSTNCTQCLPNRDPSTNCTQCLPNRDPSTNCSTCLPGWDTDSDCRVCLTGRHFFTNCTTCIPGYSGEDCQLNQSEVSIYGAVIAVLLLVILVLSVTIIIILAICCKQRGKNFSMTWAGGMEKIEVIQNEGYGVRPATIDTRHRTTTNSIELQPNLVYSMGISGESPNSQTATGASNETLDDYDYVNN